MGDVEGELREKLGELATKTRYIIDAEREMEEYKGRLAQYETEKVFMQREIIKLKQEAGERSDRARNDLDQRMEALRVEHSKLQEQLANAHHTAE
jgi:predicted  nucleic acid-binding Zn-ribbon protein